MCRRVQSLRRRAFEQQGGRCYYCNVRMWLVTPDELLAVRRSPAAASKLQCTAEHLTARCDGGTDAAQNIVAACARCNHARHQLHNPPEPPDYRLYVARQLARRCWHQLWVLKAGLVDSST